MIGWSFLRSRRWLGYFALTMAFAIACSLLGIWQLARRADARMEIDRVETNYQRAAEPVSDVLSQLDSFDISQKWTPVLLSGEYLRDQQLLVRNRPFGGNPGFEVLTPLLLKDGTVFVVDRGWLPIGNEQDYPDDVPDAPPGRVTVEVRLAAGEPTLGNRTAPTGQIATIHLPDIAERVGLPTYTGAYGLLATEDPTPATRPMAETKPLRDEGPHLSYALQWFVFAILGFFGLGYLVRQEYRAVNVDDPDEQARAELRLRKSAARKPSDSDIEDAAVDAAHSSSEATPN